MWTKPRLSTESTRLVMSLLTPHWQHQNLILIVHNCLIIISFLRVKMRKISYKQAVYRPILSAFSRNRVASLRLVDSMARPETGTTKSRFGCLKFYLKDVIRIFPFVLSYKRTECQFKWFLAYFKRTRFLFTLNKTG